MLCQKCGTDNLDNSNFCLKCGENLQNPQVNQGPYQQNLQRNNSYTRNSEGENAATVSFICGIVGLFFCGIVLGIIAIIFGNKAKRLGYTDGKVTAGIILGIISIIGWALIILFYIIFFMFLFENITYSYY